MSQTWYKERNNISIGENKATEFYNQKNGKLLRYGFDLLKTSINATDFTSIPKIIRNTPDFIFIQNGISFMIEAKCGKDCLKLKLHDLESYRHWANLGNFVFYIYSTTKREGTQISIAKIIELVNNNKYPTQRFNSKSESEHYLIPMEDIFNG